MKLWVPSPALRDRGEERREKAQRPERDRAPVKWQRLQQVVLHKTAFVWILLSAQSVTNLSFWHFLEFFSEYFQCDWTG
jgi:hypothetical protein